MIEESLTISTFILFNVLWVYSGDVLGPLMKIRKIVEINYCQGNKLLSNDPAEI